MTASSHYHPAHSVLDTNILLSHAINFVQVFVVVTKKIASEIERVYRLHHHFVGCHTPELIAATKFKTTKIKFGGLFGLSTKINTHENYPLYGNNNCCRVLVGQQSFKCVQCLERTRSVINYMRRHHYDYLHNFLDSAGIYLLQHAQAQRLLL